MTLTVSGCERSPTEPSATGWGGVWTGTIADSLHGTGTLRLILDDRRIDAERSFWTGTWTTTFSASSNDGAGTLVGGVTGTQATLSLVPTQPPSCPTPSPFLLGVGAYTAPALAATANRISGSFQFATCSAVVNGTLDVRR